MKLSETLKLKYGEDIFERPLVAPKSTPQEKRRYWFFEVKNHKAQTDNLKADISKMTDDELFDTTPVKQFTLEYVPYLLAMAHPKHHAGIKRAANYLTILKGAQEAAIVRLQTKWQGEYDEMGEMLEMAQNPNTHYPNKITFYTMQP